MKQAIEQQGVPVEFRLTDKGGVLVCGGQVPTLTLTLSLSLTLTLTPILTNPNVCGGQVPTLTLTRNYHH